MPSSVTAELVGTALIITGTAKGDTITVLEQDDRIKVKGAAIHVWSGGYYTSSIKSKKVAEIKVYGAGGDDAIDLSKLESKKRSAINGGPGKDTITGSKWADAINGGKGADTIIEDFGGADTIQPDAQDQVVTPFDYYFLTVSADMKAALGASTSAITTTADGVGRLENFEHGALIWSPTTGAHAILQQIYDKWDALNGVQGFLAYPTSDQFPANEGAGAHFQGGDIYASTGTGAHEVHGDILSRYNALGAFSFIGLPVSDQVPTLDGIGAHGDFQSGMIFWSPNSGAHVVYGAILDKWASMNYERNYLGYPTSDELSAPGGRVSHFQGGDIYWSADGGAHEVHGAIIERYQALGGPNSFLGLPITDLSLAPDGVGVYSHFQGGSIYWSPTTGAHGIGGAIRDKWASMGWERSFLGYPTTDMIAAAGGSVSHFQGGDIYYSASTGAQVVHGAILDRYAQLGGPASALGFPTTDELPTADGAGRYNWFQHGAIYWSPGTGAHAVIGAIYDKWESLNWEIGSLGYPISDQSVAPNGDRSTDFQHGQIVLSAEDGIAREIIRIDGIPGGSPQNDNWSCGPNSAARLLQYYGYNVSYDYLRSLTQADGDLISHFGMGTRPTTLRDIIGGFYPAIQMEARVSLNYGGAGLEHVLDILASGKPVIALVNVGVTAKNVFGTYPTALHYVVLDGYNRGNRTISFMDTDGNQKSWSFTEFYDRWNWQSGGPAGAVLDQVVSTHERTIIY